MPLASSSGQIVTFYSYKGGTGRSMALANTAWVLASNGLRVLVIDWDLEAPGLHRYFAPFLDDRDLSSSPGLIEFFMEYVAAAMAPPEKGVIAELDWFLPFTRLASYAISLNWSFPPTGGLDLIPAGKQEDGYSYRVNSFNWSAFYGRLGGKKFLEVVKGKLRNTYDYILIDSRTGVGDTSGICTVDMPDAVVVGYTLNVQSIEGATSVVESILSQRPDLRIIPVPMRIESAEKEKSDSRKLAARSQFSSLGLESLDKAQFPYIPYYAYEEILSTFGDRPGEPNTILEAAERLVAEITEGKYSRLQISAEYSRKSEILDAYASGLDLVEDFTKDIGRFRLAWRAWHGLRSRIIQASSIIAHPAIIVLTLIIAAISILGPRWIAPQRRGESPQVLTEVSGAVERLSFLSNENLLVAERVAPLSRVFFKEFANSEGAWKMARPPVALSELAQKCGIPSGEGGFLYDIDNTKTLAVALQKELCIVSNFDAKPSTRRIKLNPRDGIVVALAFLGTKGNELVVQFSSGRVRVFDVDRGSEKPEGTLLEGTWSLSSQGEETILALNREGSDITCIERDATGRFNLSSYSFVEATAAAAWDCSNIAIGSRGGYVIWVDRSEERATMVPSFVAPGAIRVLAAMPDGKLLAAGDFPSLFELSDQGASVFATIPAGTRLLAVGKIYAASFGSDLFVMKIKSPSDWVQDLVGGTALLVGFLGLMILIVRRFSY